jgi:glycosyltransferase involved in cell wall biosynthesis
MTFGKFGTYKVVEPLIAATQELRRSGHADLELVIAGTDSPNTPGYLESVQRTVGNEPWITFTGYVDETDVPALFQQATLVAFPYTSTTGSSGVLHQAGSFGKAVVLPQIGDLAELIREEGYAGEFFTPDEPHSMTTALASLLEDDGRRQRIEQQNYLASSSIMIDDIADWYLLHLERILKGN